MNFDKYIHYDKNGKVYLRYYTVKYLERCAKSSQE